MSMQIESLLRALADPTRLRIMRLLGTMELAVGELAQVLVQSQPRVSRHIRILCDAGLAKRRKEGSWVFLRSAIGDEHIPALGGAVTRLLATAEADDSTFAARCSADRRQLAEIRSAREASAAAYFARHAADWDRLRNLHAPDAPVEAALHQALRAQSPNGSLGALLDIGTGTGRMAELFAPLATRITGVDKSPEMLRLARTRLQTLPADRCDLLLGDFTALPFADSSFDTILLHQVLHYAQEPEVVLAEAARVARLGCCLAVIDFAQHDREELRSQHAHARLGFSEDQMLTLFRSAGFDCEPPLALPGHSLTVKIWTGRKAEDSNSQSSPPARAKATSA